VCRRSKKSIAEQIYYGGDFNGRPTGSINYLCDLQISSGFKSWDLNAQIAIGCGKIARSVHLLLVNPLKFNAFLRGILSANSWL
jgi:hypothetical protein